MPTTTIEELKAQIEAGQSDLEQTNKAGTAQKANLDSSLKALGEIDGIVKKYSADLLKLTEDKTKADDYYQKKYASAVAAVGGNKGTVDQQVLAFNKRVSDLEGAIEKLAASIAAKVQADGAAAAALEQARSEFNWAKGKPERIAGWIKTALEFSTKAEKEDPDHPANLYLLVSEIKVLLDTSGLKTPPEIQNYLIEKFTAQRTASDAAITKKTDLDKAQADLVVQRKQLAELKARRLEVLLLSINDLNLPPKPKPVATGPEPVTPATPAATQATPATTQATAAATQGPQTETH